MNRFLARAALMIGAPALVASCATSTAPGAVGITRSQLLVVPAEQLNAQAQAFYSKLSSSARQAGKLNTDAPMTQRTRSIGQRLIREVAVYRPDAAQWAWEINVFDSDELNAFCAPGGKIGVFAGLIRRLALTDEELAAVMGHEIAHALREHSREKASQQTMSSALVQGIAATGSRNAGAASALTGLGAHFFLHLPYSRNMELEADVMGLELMARAGFDPRRAPNVWRKMQQLAEGGKVEFFSTHPSSEARIRDLEGAVPKVLPLFETARRR